MSDLGAADIDAIKSDRASGWPITNLHKLLRLADLAGAHLAEFSQPVHQFQNFVGHAIRSRHIIGGDVPPDLVEILARAAGIRPGTRSFSYRRLWHQRIHVAEDTIPAWRQPIQDPAWT